MRGLILKDFYNLKRYSYTVLLTVIFMALMMLFLKDGYFLCGMIILMFTMMCITSFSYDDIAKWDQYALTLPVSRKQVVMGKYLLSLMLALAGTVLAITAGSVISFFKKFNFMDMIITCFALFALAVIFICIMLPLLYKFGVEKSRIMIIAVFAIPTASIFMLSQIGVSAPSEETVKLLMYMAPLIMLAAVFFSYRISCAVFAKKEL